MALDVTSRRDPHVPPAARPLQRSRQPRPRAAAVGLPASGWHFDDDDGRPSDEPVSVGSVAEGLTVWSALQQYRTATWRGASAKGRKAATEGRRWTQLRAVLRWWQKKGITDADLTTRLGVILLPVYRARNPAIAAPSVK